MVWGEFPPPPSDVRACVWALSRAMNVHVWAMRRRRRAFRGRNLQVTVGLSGERGRASATLCAKSWRRKRTIRPREVWQGSAASKRVRSWLNPRTVVVVVYFSNFLLIRSVVGYCTRRRWLGVEGVRVIYCRGGRKSARLPCSIRPRETCASATKKAPKMMGTSFADPCQRPQLLRAL